MAMLSPVVEGGEGSGMVRVLMNSEGVKGGEGMKQGHGKTGILVKTLFITETLHVKLVQ